MDYKEKVEELVNKGTNNIKKKVVTLNDDKPTLTKEDFNVYVLWKTKIKLHKKC